MAKKNSPQADIVTPAVTAEDPLALLDEAVAELPQRARQAYHEELLADVFVLRFAIVTATGCSFTAFLHQRDELVGNLLGLEGAGRK